MGLKIILFVYFWLYFCITNLNLRNKFCWTNYLLLFNENLLNFTICRNTKLEGAISGPDRAPHFRPRSGSDRVGRFITGLTLDRLPYRGHIFPVGARSAPHRNFCLGYAPIYLTKNIYYIINIKVFEKVTILFPNDVTRNVTFTMISSESTWFYNLIGWILHGEK